MIDSISLLTLLPTFSWLSFFLFFFFFWTFWYLLSVRSTNKSTLSSVSDANREIQTLRKMQEIPTLGTIDTGNSVYLVSGIFRWPEGWHFSVCIGDWWLIIFLTYYLKKSRSFKKNICTISVIWRSRPNVIWRSSLRRVSNVCKQLTSF